MDDTIVLELAGIVVIGVAAQWLANALKIPSILLLLGAGVLVGPVLGWLDPDALFGDLLTPFVSLAVGIILFEGGLSLRFGELRGVGGVTWRLITLGALVTWLIVGAAALVLFDAPGSVAALLGAILIVSGPTVIVPLLRQVRPVRRLATILKWEGIIIDAVGTMFAVLVFEAILRGQADPSILGLIGEVALFILIGVTVGAVVAGVVIALLRRFTIPEFLHSGVSMMMALVAFTGANALQHESGLLAVIVLGVALANQPFVQVDSIIEFSETIRGLLIGVLFVVLAARLDLGAMLELGMAGVVFLVVVIVVARPVVAWISTVGSDLAGPERAFLAGVAPRGIVAASIAALFAAELTEADVVGADILEPAAFLIILGTVLVYGLGAGPLARRLGVARPEPQTVLIVGADRLARTVAEGLRDAGATVTLVATNRTEGYTARIQGLPTSYTSVLGEDRDDDLVEDTAVVLAVTPNDDYNSLVCLRLSEDLGQLATYQLHASQTRSATSTEEATPADDRTATPPTLRGRLLFAPGLDHATMSAMLDDGFGIRVTRITQEFGLAQYRRTHPDAEALFNVDAEGGVRPLTHDGYVDQAPEAGDRIVALVPRTDPRDNTERAP